MCKFSEEQRLVRDQDVVFPGSGLVHRGSFRAVLWWIKLRELDVGVRCMYVMRVLVLVK